MATKRSKEVLVSGERAIAAELKPRDIDAKYYGDEPLFATQPDEDRRGLALVIGFNWYNKFFSSKEAKGFLADYAKSLKMVDEAALLSRASDSEVLPTLGWLARMYLRGLALTESEQSSLRNEISRLANSVAKPTVVPNTAEAQQKEVAEQASRPNIQEIMRERTREVGGEIEGWLDDFIMAGARGGDISVNSVGVLSERNILPQHVSILTDSWKTKLGEFEAVLGGKDEQLNEAYGHLNKTQLKGLVKFCEAVLASLNSYISVKKANKQPRKKKAVSPEKVVAKLKYLKDFAELKLTSAAPKTLVGATEIWLYDTVKRKLHYYVADDHVGTMTVKGTTIIGFDSTKSGVKTVRKPQDVLKKLMSGGKPASRKVFSEINAVHAQPNGRTNEAMIILKAY
jgi:hypothetical protein